jgi:hypothetical protein
MLILSTCLAALNFLCFTLCLIRKLAAVSPPRDRFLDPPLAVRLRGAVPERHRHARAAEVPARRRGVHHQQPAGRRRARAQHGVRAELEAGGGRGVRTVRESRRPVRATSAGGARGVDLRVLPSCGEPSVDSSENSRYACIYCSPQGVFLL